MKPSADIGAYLKEINSACLNPLDLIPRNDLAEKLIELVMFGPGEGIPAGISSQLRKLADVIKTADTSAVRVVVIGGGTGLSNIIGGDSRLSSWPAAPFQGLKKIIPHTRAITCITDDGGSTGELLKDLPLIALGDIRHVLLSSIQEDFLAKYYRMEGREAFQVVEILHGLFNYRFDTPLVSADQLLNKAAPDFSLLPEAMARGLRELTSGLFRNEKLIPVLRRKQCLGNLLLVSSIYRQDDPDDETVIEGIKHVASLIGAHPCAVLPCSTTPGHLQILYSNGVLVIGEHKSSVARRGYPIEKVLVQFSGPPNVPEEVISSIDQADILIFAPGSLYTSIIPVLHVPGIADAVRNNQKALKILVANLWAQEGETDISKDDPQRRFYVSDLIAAYSRNIPGGIKDLFQQILVLALRDIPGSILQQYAVENKIPIYLDTHRVVAMGLKPVQAGIFSQKALTERRVLQHCPAAFATAVQTLWTAKKYLALEG